MSCPDGGSTPASSTASSGSAERAVVQLRAFSYTYPQAAAPILSSIDLELEPGTCSLITGGTGAGKSTLLMAIKGVLPAVQTDGEIRFPSEAKASCSRFGLVLQNPETQLLSPTLGGEVAFGLENLQISSSCMQPLVQKALQDVGLDKPLSTPVDSLSMGQKYRLLLAAMLVMEPELLMLDEPSAQLDPEGLHRLRAVIRSLKRSGLAFLIAEHRTDLLAEEADAHYVLANGRLERGGRLRRGPWPKRDRLAAKPPRSDPPVLEAEGLAQSFPSGNRVWDNVSLRLAPGERAVLVGPNGSGKSTLLRCLCGLSRPVKGAVRVLGKAPYPRQLCGQVGYLQQNPQRQLFETTLCGEIEFTLKRLGWSQEARLERAQSMLERCGLSRLGLQSPYMLSFGQQHLAALAALFAPKPSLLLLDDPFVGLDWQTEQAMVQLLEELSLECSTAVVYAGHNDLEPFPWAHSRYRLQGGELVKESAPAESGLPEKMRLKKITIAGANDR